MSPGIASVEALIIRDLAAHVAGLGDHCLDDLAWHCEAEGGRDVASIETGDLRELLRHARDAFAAGERAEHALGAVHRGEAVVLIYSEDRRRGPLFGWAVRIEAGDQWRAVPQGRLEGEEPLVYEAAGLPDDLVLRARHELLLLIRSMRHVYGAPVSLYGQIFRALQRTYAELNERACSWGVVVELAEGGLGDPVAGLEAEELRCGLEELERAGGASAEELRKLLDRVCARDSLAHLIVTEGSAP